MNISVENPILQNEIIKKSGNKTKRVRNVATRTNLDVKPARGKIEQGTKAVESGQHLIKPILPILFLLKLKYEIHTKTIQAVSSTVNTSIIIALKKSYRLIHVTLLFFQHLDKQD